MCVRKPTNVVSKEDFEEGFQMSYNLNDRYDREVWYLYQETLARMEMIRCSRDG
jgi:hypothetical protein